MHVSRDFRELVSGFSEENRLVLDVVVGGIVIVIVIVIIIIGVLLMMMASVRVPVS